MTTLAELEALAKAAKCCADVDEPEWYELDALLYAVGHEDDARFLTAANPATILALIELCKQQHEALKESAAQVKELITVFHVPSPEASFDRYKEAIAAFDHFGKE